MNVLILGANGLMGPHVVRALESNHRLLITDIKPPNEPTRHESRIVDVASFEQVRDAAKGMDAIINLAVQRTDRQLAFDVNTRGCYNVMRAAVEHKIRRVINTGPHFTVAGPAYEGFDFGITPDSPPQPGTNLYALSKSLGQEICRVFAQQHDIHVLELLFYSLRDPATLPRGADTVPFTVSWADAAQAFRLALEIDAARLPSKCEVFFIFADMPHGQFVNEKAKRILGFAPKDDLSALWRKSGSAAR